MVGPTATFQYLEHHGGLSHLAWSGYDLHEPSGLVCAFQQDVGVWASPEGRLRIVHHSVKLYTV